MNVIFVILGLIGGTAAAFVLNKLVTGKIKDKTQRIGLKAASYIVCSILGMVFAIIGSLRPILDDFMRGRISFIETELAQLFPDSNILETRIETHELAAVVDTVRQTADAVNTSRDGFLEKIIFKVFLNKLTGYISAAESGINTMKIMTNENGAVTIKSILFGVKDLTLETVSPYFIFGQIGVLVLLLLFIGIYVGIAVYLIKGGAMYNKSIVFGNITGNKSAEN